MIPFHTTTVDVYSPEPERDSGDPYSEEPLPEETKVAGDVRAVITENAGGPVGPGDNELTKASMRCDPCTIEHRSRVVDLVTGQEYLVDSAFLYDVLPLSHMKVRLTRLNLGGG